MDEPLVEYAGAGTGAPLYHLADERGSVIARTTAAGAVYNAINTYDEYGVPAATVTGRFQYTGQTRLTDTGLYHYKARVYAPVLGRFLQTDPIGYRAGLNLYAYVGADPVNGTDSTGMATCGSTLSQSQCTKALTDQTAALGAVTGARADLAALKAERAAIAAGGTDPLSAAAVRAESALKLAFDSTSDATLSAVDGMLANTEAVLSDTSGKYTYEQGSAAHSASLGTPFPPGVTVQGYTYNGASSIWLLTGSDTGTLIHEPPHIFGANLTVDELYDQRALNRARQTGGTQLAIGNADNYLIFVRSLRPF